MNLRKKKLIILSNTIAVINTANVKKVQCNPVYTTTNWPRESDSINGVVGLTRFSYKELMGDYIFFTTKKCGSNKRWS